MLRMQYTLLSTLPRSEMVEDRIAKYTTQKWIQSAQAVIEPSGFCMRWMTQAQIWLVNLAMAAQNSMSAWANIQGVNAIATSTHPAPALPTTTFLIFRHCWWPKSATGTGKDGGGKKGEGVAMGLTPCTDTVDPAAVVRSPTAHLSLTLLVFGPWQTLHLQCD